MPLVYTDVTATVNPATNIGIDEQLADLRLRLVVGEVNKRVGQRIRERRTELRFTQKQVAARMREVAKERGEDEPAVDAQRISDWERSYNMPSERYLGLLVAALEVEGVSYFYAEPSVPQSVKTPDPFPVNSGLGGRLEKIEERLAAIEVTQKALLASMRELAKRLPPPSTGRQRQAR